MNKLLLWLILTIGHMHAQNITRVEYFIDSDPGFDNATTIPFSESPNVTVNAHSISIAALDGGFHTLYIRARDANGKWSAMQAKAFYKTPATGPVAPNVTAVEYFIDKDPGLGLATNVPITPGTNVAQSGISVGISSLLGGFHTLYIRAKDADSNWTVLSAKAFYKIPSITDPLANIVKMEYFVDKDPGFDKASNISITPGTDITKNEVIDISAVSGGFHTLYIRAKDADSNWTVLSAKPFYKTPSITDPLANIVKMEYFVDKDPGFDKASNILITPGTDITKNEVIDISAVSGGFHTLYVRAKDSDSNWTVLSAKAFYKTPPTVAAPSKIVEVDYYFLKGGVSTLTRAFTGFSASANVALNFVPDISGLQIDSTYDMYVYGRDSSGLRGLASGKSFITPDVVPAMPKALTGVAQNGQIMLSWSKNNESDFLRYRIYRSTSPNAVIQIDSSTGGNADTSKTIFGLANGTNYYFRVTAVDSAFQVSAYSNEVSTSPVDAVPPAVPQSLIVTAGGHAQITIKWKPNSDLDFRRYRIYRNTSPNASLQIDSTSGGITDTIRTYTGLIPGTMYYFRVGAVDTSFNVSAYSNEASAVPLDLMNPASPQNLTAIAGNAQIVLTWNRNSESDFKRYRIYRSTSPNASIQSDSTNGGSTDTIRTYTGLVPGTTYYFRVTAVDTSLNVSTYSNEVSAIPIDLSPPAAPQNFSATAYGSVATLKWRRNSEPDFKRYRIYQSTSAGASVQVDSTTAGATDTTKSIAGLSFGVTYYFRARAVDTSGLASVYSNESSVTTPNVLNLTTSILQNPALPKYTDVYVVADTQLISAPEVKIFIGNDSTILTMNLVPGSARVYRGSYSLLQNGNYTIRTSGTAITGSSSLRNRSFTAVLAKPKESLFLTTPDGLAELRMEPGMVSSEGFILGFSDGTVEFISALKLQRPAELSITIDQNIPDVDKAFIYELRGGSWQKLKTRFYASEHELRTKIDRLGTFRFEVDPAFAGSNLVPESFALKSNYPNPFNPSTTIEYDLSKDGVIELSIYNVLGQKVKTLADGYSLAGNYRVVWNGDNSSGMRAASGVYIYRLSVPGYVRSRRMVLIK